jgi:hypothetical protein
MSTSKRRRRGRLDRETPREFSQKFPMFERETNDSRTFS